VKPFRLSESIRPFAGQGPLQSQLPELEVQGFGGLFGKVPWQNGWKRKGGAWSPLGAGRSGDPPAQLARPRNLQSERGYPAWWPEHLFYAAGGLA
jgi:hypothetical protein